jgi:hypothetical protein
LNYWSQETGRPFVGKINLVDASNPLMNGTFTVRQAIPPIRQLAIENGKMWMGKAGPVLTFGM